MKVSIPQDLKTDVPSTPFGKILSATPVVMAVIATMLAGMASSEMTRAQYERSLGAQQQSKAGDQWSFFQAKRLRGAVQQNSVDLLQSTTVLHPLDSPKIKAALEQPGAPDAEKLRAAALAQLESPSGQEALALVSKGEVPRITESAPLDPRLKAALDGMENLKSDAEMEKLMAQVDNKLLDDALASARDKTQEFDTATKPVNQLVDQLDHALARRSAPPASTSPEETKSPPSASDSLYRDFTVARLRYAASRYETEARLNQVIANLYELQVRKSNIAAEHHHRRSQRFFFGMLGAQMGVIISTFALAARNRSFLWSLAAGAGILAVAFAVYVYLFV